MKRPISFVIIFYVSLSFASCYIYNPHKQLYPPPTFPLSRTVLGYIVITDSYTQLLDHIGTKGVSLGILRKGTILPVLERKIIKGETGVERWIYVDAEEKAWIRASSGLIFQTEAQAKTALRQLMQGRE